MTRDWELIRNLLREIEDASAEKPPDFPGIGPYGASSATVEETLIMIERAGLITWRHKSRTYSGTSFGHIMLTMEGYDLLTAIAEKTIWSKIKTQVGSALATLPISIVIALGMKHLGEQFGVDIK